MKDPITFAFQWEALQSKRRVIRLQHAGKLLTGSATATIERNDSYQIICQVQGFADSSFTPQQEFQQRVFGGSFQVEGECDGFLASFRNCQMIGMQSHVDCESGTYKNNSFSLSVHTDFFELKSRVKFEKLWHVDWFLNGPKDSIYNRCTNHQFDFGARWTVDGIEEAKKACSTVSSGGSVDCAWIKSSKVAFIIRRASGELAPEWSRGIAIEYCQKLSPIPDEETRKAIAEIVGFVIGRRLIDVADSSFADGEHNFFMQHWDKEEGFTPAPVAVDLAYEFRCWNPTGINIRSLCEKIDFAPIPIERLHRTESQELESILPDLIVSYLKHRKILCLDDALWRYWTFQELPLGVNLPMLVNGIEILASAWFASDYSSSCGNFTSKDDFLQVLRKDFENIRGKLLDASHANPKMERLKKPELLGALMTRLENSFQMGPNARMRRFFEEIEIEPSKAEIAALSSRHIQIHSAVKSSDGKELWVHSENLRTLFYKIMLRLLGYSGPYYSTAEGKVCVLSPRQSK